MWKNVTAEDIDHVIRAVNAQHGTHYELLNRFDKGEWGAYRIAEPCKQPVVLKFFLNLSNTNIVDADPDLARNITDRLLSLGYPVPKYIYSGLINHGIYWVQQELPGKPLWVNPTVEQIERILSFLLLQENQAVSEKQNYSLLIKDTVFGKRLRGLQSVQNYSSELREFLDKLMLSVKDLEGLMLPKSDIVHGDFSYHQVMIDDGNITGIIDWQEAGCGDWLVDLTRLIYSLHDRPQLANPVIKHVKQEGLPRIRLYTAFTAIEMLSWPIQQSQTNIEKSFHKAKSAVDFVFEKNCIY
jgi:hypothetical protein